MIGDGDQLEGLKQRAEDENIKNIVFTGRLSNQETIERLSKCDILTVTSSKEGLPKVVLEAASCGVVPMYINEYYSIDYIENGVNGYGIKNLEEMKSVINSLVNNEEFYSKLSNNALKLYDRFCWKAVISEYNEYFMSV